MKPSLISLAALVLGVQVSSAAVVSDTNVVVLETTEFDANYEVQVFQNEAGTAVTSFWFDSSPSALTVITWTLDEGAHWYLTSFGDEFSQSNIFDGDFVSIFDALEDDISVGPDPFYLGIMTGQEHVPNSVYGWIQLQNTNGELTVLGNAMNYDSIGIVVGTTNSVIPEPSSTVLLAMGALAFWRRRRSY